MQYVLKQKYLWLKEVDKFAISNSIYNLDNACIRYMSKLWSKPKIKKYRSIVLAKIHRKIEGKIINATVKKYGKNKYKVMVLVKREMKEKNSCVVGLDMGITNFVTDNVGKTYNSPKALVKTYDKIGKIQNN